MLSDRVPFDPTYAPVTKLTARIRRGKLSPIELTEHFLAKLDQLNPELHAFISIATDRALAASEAIETAIKNGTKVGPLAGVPFACKDVFWTCGLRTTGGSLVLENWVPPHDAGVIKRLVGAGAILIGKTNLHEFGYGATGINPHFGTVVNPWDRHRIAGGSSTGSAIAVACGLVPFALGTDAGGSVRAPAALCGVVGLKPTYGRVTTSGTIPYSWTLDHVGLFTRSVADAAIVLESLAGFDPEDPVSVPVRVAHYRRALCGNIRGLQIGVPRNFFFEHVDPEITSATFGVLKCAEQLGAKLTDVSMPDLTLARTVSLVIQMPELLSYHSRFIPDKRELYGDDLRAGFAVGQFILAEHYIRAKRMVTLYRRKMAEVFEAIDLLVTPTCPIIAPRLGVATVTTEGKEEPVGDAHSRFTSFFNLTGHPALSVPSGWHSLGLPMGVQLVGRPFEEATLLRAGDALEHALNLPTRHPAVR